MRALMRHIKLGYIDDTVSYGNLIKFFDINNNLIDMRFKETGSILVGNFIDAVGVTKFGIRSGNVAYISTSKLLDFTDTNKLSFSFWGKFSSTSPNFFNQSFIPDVVNSISNISLQSRTFWISGAYTGVDSENYINSSPINVAQTTVSYRDNRWRHIVFVKNRDNAGTLEWSIYINGVQVTQTIPSPHNYNYVNNFKSSNGMAMFGNLSTASEVFFSNFRCYKKPLTQSEITDLYNEPIIP